MTGHCPKTSVKHMGVLKRQIIHKHAADSRLKNNNYRRHVATVMLINGIDQTEQLWMKTVALGE